MISTVLLLLHDMLSLKTYVEVPVSTVSKKKKKFKIGILKASDEKSRIRIRLKNVTDPEHWQKEWMRSGRGLERLTVNATVTSALGSIPASTDPVASTGGSVE